MTPESQVLREEAVARMKMSEEFSKFLRKAYDLFGQPQSLIGKNLTKTAFWFYIDAMHFYTNEKQDFSVLKQFIHPSYQFIQQFEELEDLQFILKIRKLISQQKLGTLNLSDIRSTHIDQVIEVSEAYLQQEQARNKSLVESLTKKYQDQRKGIKNQLSKFDLQYVNSHPMFYYEQFEAVLRSKWMQQDKKKQSKEKCYLCSVPNKLISCNNCSLKVHPACYPTFMHRYENKNSKPSEEELKKFICENCANKISPEKQKCELCCCLGGQFVKANLPEQTHQIISNNQLVFEQPPKCTNLQLKLSPLPNPVKNKYIHLTCFIWNTELKWNSNTNMAQGLNRIIRKKANGICSLCGIGFGTTIPCSNDTCRRFYHGQCAKRNQLQMNLIRAKTSVIQLFCERHRHLNRYEALQQAGANKFKQVKKMFQGIDKQIKRINVSASYQQIKLVVERDYCSICGKEEGWQKITICKQCRKWYHNNCSQNCKNCA